MRNLLVVMFVLTFGTATAVAGKQVRYAGAHPVPRSEGGGICYIEAPHVHIYPAAKLEYRVHGNDHVFVGDPVAYGWEGPKHAYKGPHPIQLDVIVGGDPDVEYCYLEGPHYHASEPPPGPDFVVTGGAYFWVGEPPRAFLDARPAYVGINAMYRPMTYARPVIEVQAPSGWIGARVALAPAVVVAPKVRGEVHVPAPGVRVGIEILAPAIIVQPQPTVILVPHGKFKAKGKYKHKWH
jgi:hypothetical protein